MAGPGGTPSLMRSRPMTSGLMVSRLTRSSSNFLNSQRACLSRPRTRRVPRPARSAASRRTRSSISPWTSAARRLKAFFVTDSRFVQISPARWWVRMSRGTRRPMLVPLQVWTLNRARIRRAARSLWMSWPQEVTAIRPRLYSQRVVETLPRSW